MVKWIQDQSSCVSDPTYGNLIVNAQQYIDFWKQRFPFYIDFAWQPLLSNLPNTSGKYWRRIRDITNNDFVKKNILFINFFFYSFT